MSYELEQVYRFYEEIWNRNNKDEIPRVLHEGFSFRGSLGKETIGHAGFAAYLEMVHATLGSYRSDIKETVVEGSTVFAKMEFSGIHQNLLMGYAPTGRKVCWQGAALFHFEQGRVSNLWVLGDIRSLESQLAED
jgi:predicted ester cyclase